MENYNNIRCLLLTKLPYNVVRIISNYDYPVCPTSLLIKDVIDSYNRLSPYSQVSSSNPEIRKTHAFYQYYFKWVCDIYTCKSVFPISYNRNNENNENNDEVATVYDENDDNEMEYSWMDLLVEYASSNNV